MSRHILPTANVEFGEDGGLVIAARGVSVAEDGAARARRFLLLRFLGGKWESRKGYGSPTACWCLIVLSVAILLCMPANAEGQPRYRFKNVTSTMGISTEKTLTFGSTWNDHDRDGDPDLFLNRHWRKPWFYKNEGLSYVLARQNFVEHSMVDRHGCSWGEANGDGRPDLYCTRGADHGEGEGKNQLWLQKRDGLLERAALYNVRDRFGRGRSANWIDYDEDRDLDLFVTNAFRVGVPSVMFRNDQRGFRRVDVGVGDQIPGAWPSSSWSDWDADGDPDLLVVGRRFPAFAYENQGGRFQPVSLPGVTDRAWLSSAWGDYDGDGLPDLHLVDLEESVIAHNHGGGFDVVRTIPGDESRMSVWFDIENDGDLDLFVVQGAEGPSPETGSENHPDFLLVMNDGGFDEIRHRSFRGPYRGNGDTVVASDHDRDGRVDVFITNGHNPSSWTGRGVLLENRSTVGRWAELRLHAGPENPWAIGARITVTTSRTTYQRQLTDGVNYRSQSDVSYVHLGLGRAWKARVEVKWPTGGKDCIRVHAHSMRRLSERSHHPCN